MGSFEIELLIGSVVLIQRPAAFYLRLLLKVGGGCIAGPVTPLPSSDSWEPGPPPGGAPMPLKPHTQGLSPLPQLLGVLTLRDSLIMRLPPKSLPSGEKMRLTGKGGYTNPLRKLLKIQDVITISS